MLQIRLIRIKSGFQSLKGGLLCHDVNMMRSLQNPTMVIERGTLRCIGKRQVLRGRIVKHLCGFLLFADRMLWQQICPYMS